MARGARKQRADYSKSHATGRCGRRGAEPRWLELVA